MSTSDKIIRELLVNVKQVGSTKATKAIVQLSNAIVDAGAATELTNNELVKMPSNLSRVESSANKAAKALANLNNQRGGGAGNGTNKAIKDMAKALDQLLAEMIHTREGMTRGFAAMGSAANSMGSMITAAIERSEDQLIDLNAAARRARGGLDDLGGAGNRLNRILGNTAGSSRGVGREFAKLARDGGGLTIMYAAIAANVYVLKAAFDQLRAGDQLSRLEEFGVVMGGMTGTPVQALATSLREATNNAVSFEEAMKQASMASAYGFSSEQIGQFALVARRAAAVLGVDMTDALNRVIKGVSKQEIELLDELGVTIRLNEAYAAHVKVLNAANTGITYNIQNLTTYQKQQAYANAVIAQSTKYLGALDQQLRATPWEEFGANAEGALKRFQMAAAKYLTPVVNTMNAIFYRTQNMETLNLAADQTAATKLIDPSNAAALVESLTNSRGEFEKWKKEQENRKKETQVLLKEFEALNNYAPGSIDQAIFATKKAVNDFTGFSGGMFETPERKAQLDRVNNLYARLVKARKESDDEAAAGKALQDSIKASEDQLAKNTTLQKNLTDNSGMYAGLNVVDENKLKSAQSVLGEWVQFNKNSSKDIMAAWGDLSSDKNILTASGGFKQALNIIKQTAATTGESLDALAAKSGMNVSSFAELEARSKSVASYLDAVGKKEKDALAIEQAKNAVLVKGGLTKAAENAGNKVKADLLDRQIEATKKMIALNPDSSVVLQKELTKLETEKLQAQNSQLGTAEKTEKVKTKAIGIEKQIELAQDRTKNAQQFTLATLEAQLEVDKLKAKELQSAAKQQADYKTQLLAIAQTERSISEELYNQNLARKQRATSQAMALSQAGGELGIQEQAALERRNIEQQILDIQNAASESKTALDTQRIAELQDQLAVANKQAQTNMAAQNRGFQNSTTGLLGGTYSSTEGMSAEMKQMTEFQNSQDGYAQAISNLQSINSEATNAGQSIGNLVNAMMQYSKGSLDFTSVAAAGMQTIGQFISYGANQQVKSIDAAIAAEQARDGQSEESKAKIKKMEAEKLKIQQDAAKKQILIQTAVAVMQAATSVPYPWSIPLMIAAAAAGAMSLAQASNPGSASLSGLDSGTSSAASLKVGERDKSVDVSQSSNGGEISYMQGAKGVGNANSFIPRAEGGNMIPGVGYITGENGIEVITPNVPSTVTPASELGKKGSRGSGNTYHVSVNTMDAKSFRDFALENPEAFRAAVEMSLNESGSSLSRLDR